MTLDEKKQPRQPQRDVGYLAEHIKQIKEIAADMSWPSQRTKGRFLLHLGSCETIVAELKERSGF
jgi:hypothetical protein